MYQPITACLVLLLGLSTLAAAPRETISLDGTWQIADGKLDTVPSEFSRTVLVPGFVDLAQPAFDDVAPRKLFKDPKRDAFWYRREFNLDKIPTVARLKIHKAMFGSKVIVNGQEVGDHFGSVTPAYFEVTGKLKKGKNEIIVRVGADLQATAGKAVWMSDYEKIHYIPGIFDSVELICSGTPYIENIQTAPDIQNGKVRIQIRLVNSGAAVRTSLKLTIKEWKSGKSVGNVSVPVKIPKKGETTIDSTVAIENCQLWSPESPFLYVAEINTGADFATTRFGMRTFRFNTETKQAELNGKPYIMRGTNFTAYRFFEDPLRGTLPWDEKWVRTLHERLKGMHWNCVRYCIGFPPEKWYDIADETGVLIQDEFPIWDSDVQSAEKRFTTDILVAEYSEWMRERWNHPSVVIWDACNETWCSHTGEAIAKVRGLDLSNRPWDNGYNPPAQPGDVLEIHPYHFFDSSFKLRSLGKMDGLAGNKGMNDGIHAAINNEYGWLWLNRDGTPTTLTRTLYSNLLGSHSTAEQRFYTCATYLAADTEFFRAHRKCAAVMHFTMLGYARPDGQTSDHWKNIETLEWEPLFHQYVRDAFAPVGLMLDFWNDRIPENEGRVANIPVVLINDLDKPWSGTITFRLKKGDTIIFETVQTGDAQPCETSRVSFEVSQPKELGSYRWEAELTGSDGEPVTSVRDFQVIEQSKFPISIKQTYASSEFGVGYAAKNAIDITSPTHVSYWSSDFKDDEWILFDLGEIRQCSGFAIDWETAFAKKYNIKVSSDAENWTQVYSQEAGSGGHEEISINSVECRYVRINCLERGTQWGNAIIQFEVYGK